MKNLKPVPADKKKSLGKLPTDVRNKMGYAQKGKMMSKRDKLIEKQNPKSEYKKDKFGKTKLSYTEAKKGSMMKAKEGKMTDMMFRPTPEQAAKMSNDPTRKARLKKLLENRIKNTKPDSSNTKQKLKDALKKLGSAASPAAATAKKTMEIIKKSKGGEMKKPMKAGLGKMVKKFVGSVFGKKSSVSSPNTNMNMSFQNGKLPIVDLYQKATEQQVAKKSMGGEMKQGYGAARTSGMGLQDEDLIPGKSMDYYKDLM